MRQTGLYYYGARYYNPKLSIWYGVDPHAESYPNLSPYSAFANNPILYVDPDGRDIIITWEIDGKSHSMTYSYEKDRTFAEGTPEFVQNTVSSLNQLYSTGVSKITFGEGESAKTVDIMGSFMDNKEHNLTIQEGASNKYNTKTLSFNHDEGAKFMKESFDGGKSFNFGNYDDRVKLGQELIKKAHNE